MSLLYGPLKLLSTSTFKSKTTNPHALTQLHQSKKEKAPKKKGSIDRQTYEKWDQATTWRPCGKGKGQSITDPPLPFIHLFFLAPPLLYRPTNFPSFPFPSPFSSLSLSFTFSLTLRNSFLSNSILHTN